MFWTLLLFLAVLSILVFVHEFGHFLTAKKMGMKVEEFGFGFPPRAWSFRRGGTDYSINWIPLGGFVKIKGESGEDRDHPDSFAGKPAWKRLAVLVAGVTMNLVLAAVLLSIGFMVGLPTVVDGEVSPHARLTDETVRIVTVLPESPAGDAGVASGDILLSIDGQTFADADAARAYITAHSTQEIEFALKRQDEYITARMTAEELPEVGTLGVGVGLVKTASVAYPWYLAIVNGVIATGVFTWEVVKAFADLLTNLIVRQEVSVDLSGPVGIAVMTGQAAALGVVYLLQFTALLSINLAVVNILPFPALDGGRVLFLAIEKFRRKPVNERIEALVHNLGFAFLMGLVILVTYRDLVRFGDQILGTLKGLIGA
jgi:regulator of sigma E protease